MFDVEVDTPSMTQVRHIKSDAVVVIWHETNKVEVTPGFNPACPLDVNDRKAVDTLVTNVREWLEKRQIIKRRVAQNAKELNSLREQLRGFEALPARIVMPLSRKYNA